MTSVVVLLLGGCTAPTDSAEPVDDSGSASRCLTDGVGFERPFDVDSELYPFDSCVFETTDGLLHYVDAGPLDAEHTVLLVHGNPTWSFLYRNIAAELVSEGHRVVVPDHLGMGMSEVPSTSAFDYRPRSHAAHLEDLVVALDLDNLTMVVQDWGGPIGLGVATRQPDRVGRLFIMNTWAWGIDPVTPGTDHAVVDWYDTAVQLEANLPGWFCQLALPGQSELNAAAADPTLGQEYEAVLAAYVSPHIDPTTGDYVSDEPCAPMQIFAESILDDNAYQVEVEAGLTALAGKPYSLMTGQSDILFGALRCDADADTPCPGTSTCACVAEALPSRVEADCDSAPQDYFVCVEQDGSLIEPYADRFTELLGPDTLVTRTSILEADHMVQEYAPDQVVAGIRALLEE